MLKDGKRNQSRNILQGKQNFKCKTQSITGMLRIIPDHSEEEWPGEELENAYS
jgi:hypothetical protein